MKRRSGAMGMWVVGFVAGSVACGGPSSTRTSSGTSTLLDDAVILDRGLELKVTPTCKGDAFLCDDKCVSLEKDPQHCGACGNACASGDVCNAGACSADCPGPRVNCGGTCVNPSTSTTYCGATLGCGTSGGTAGASCSAGEVCAAGSCGSTCSGADIDCGGSCIDPKTSKKHCGATPGCGADAGIPGV